MTTDNDHNTPRLGQVLVGNRHHGDEGIYIGRGSPFGNEYTREVWGRTGALALYEAHLEAELDKPGSQLGGAVRALAERVRCGENLVLVCSCAPKPCHGDIIIEAIDALLA
jgi:hypothetical protein